MGDIGVGVRGGPPRVECLGLLEEEGDTGEVDWSGEVAWNEVFQRFVSVGA